ncbi:hypothetical protein HDV03_000051 [Kappamyces sp. JEL0829]|nr:hypothetical protein HDV03_000051 [Kappamyces sp. JEL0829]
MALQPSVLDSKFDGRAPPRIARRQTDHDFEVVPRPIYNGYFKELQLREEGFSGTQKLRKLEPVKHRVRTNPITVDETLEFLSKKTCVQQNKAIDDPELFQDIVEPIGKPKISSPLEKPVHSIHDRDIFRPFPKTYRYGSLLNTLNCADASTVNHVHAKCAEMERLRDQAARKSSLRYQKKLEQNESTQRARGLSFRGRGQLDIRMGWSKAVEFADNAIGGDISDFILQPSYVEQVSFTSDLSAPDEPKFASRPQDYLVAMQLPPRPRPSLLTPFGAESKKSIETPDKPPAPVPAVVDNPKPAADLIDYKLMATADDTETGTYSVTIKQFRADEKPTIVKKRSTLSERQSTSIPQEQAVSAPVVEPATVSPSSRVETKDTTLPLTPQSAGQSPAEQTAVVQKPEPQPDVEAVLTPKDSLASPDSITTKEDEEAWMKEQKKNMFGVWRPEELPKLPEKAESPVTQKISKKAPKPEKPAETKRAVSRFDQMLKKAQESEASIKISTADGSAFAGPDPLPAEKTVDGAGDKQARPTVAAETEVSEISKPIQSSALLDTAVPEAPAATLATHVVPVPALDPVHPHSAESSIPKESSLSPSPSPPAVQPLKKSRLEQMLEASSSAIAVPAVSTEPPSIPPQSTKPTSPSKSSLALREEPAAAVDAISSSNSLAAQQRSKSNDSLNKSDGKETKKNSFLASLTSLRTRSNPKLNENVQQLQTSQSSVQSNSIDAANKAVMKDNSKNAVAEIQPVKPVDKPAAALLEKTASFSVADALESTKPLESVTIEVKTAPKPEPSESESQVKLGPRANRFMNAMDMAAVQSTAPASQTVQKPEPKNEEANKKTELKASTQSLNVQSAAPRKSHTGSVISCTDAESEKWLAAPQPVVWKEKKCEIRVSEFELYCSEAGKGKQQYKPYLPIALRRIICATVDKANVIVTCCIPRKGSKEGGELKTIKLSFGDAAGARLWKDHLLNLSFGGLYDEAVRREILVLAEKSDKDSQKLIEKYMVEVFEASRRPFQVQTVQYNEFSVQNVLDKQDFSKLGNIIVTNPDFIARLQQVLVRSNHELQPTNLVCERDPVDAALDIVRSSIGKKKQSVLHVSGVQLKREDKGVFSIFKK